MTTRDVLRCRYRSPCFVILTVRESYVEGLKSAIQCILSRGADERRVNAATEEGPEGYVALHLSPHRRSQQLVDSIGGLVQAECRFGGDRPLMILSRVPSNAACFELPA